MFQQLLETLTTLDSNPFRQPRASVPFIISFTHTRGFIGVSFYPKLSQFHIFIPLHVYVLLVPEPHPPATITAASPRSDPCFDVDPTWLERDKNKALSGEEGGKQVVTDLREVRLLFVISIKRGFQNCMF